MNSTSDLKSPGVQQDCTNRQENIITVVKKHLEVSVERFEYNKFAKDVGMSRAVNDIGKVGCAG